MEDRYYIKNKDNVIGAFHWDGPAGAIYPVLDQDICLPWFITNSLGNWLSARTPPKHRANMQKLLEMCGLSDTRDIINYSKGLSLLDTLWVTADYTEKWGQVNLFENEFDDVIARTAFDGGLKGLKFSTTSPSAEFATDGALPKCWVRENGSIFLKKGGTSGASNTGNEPYSEAMVSQILDVLGYHHVHYDVEHFRGRVVSSCPLMTSQTHMLLPMYMYDNFSDLGLIIQKCVQLGVEKQLYEYLIIDYLTCNTDRHLGNFGVLLDADTYDVVSMAPIYDNGMGMLPMWTPYTPIWKYVNELPGTALDVSFDTSAKVAKGTVGSHGVEKLIGFRFDRNNLLDFPEERIKTLEGFLQVRVRDYLSL